ncbi:MAG: SIS domain-containing protein [Steroidobacteraceae bacterium]
MPTKMYREAGEAAAAVRAQLELDGESMRQLGVILRDHPPRIVVTCARGSSDHAATYAKYLIESHAHVATSSAAPSISSIYAAGTDLSGALFIAISQSGRSPDLLSTVASARLHGARVIALCNSADSSLATTADHFIPLRAGAETSVAATKSYIASLSAVLHLVAHWTLDHDLLDALNQLPAQLEQARELDWQDAIPPLQSATNLFVVGRGYGLGIAQEAALKLKETAGLHAEAFSSAEVQHGPMALVRSGFPVLVFSQNDDTREGIRVLTRAFVDRGANVMCAGVQATGAIQLPTIAAHPVVEPILMVQSFYGLANAVSIARGFNPDLPPHLLKVTETR